MIETSHLLVQNQRVLMRKKKTQGCHCSVLALLYEYYTFFLLQLLLKKTRPRQPLRLHLSPYPTALGKYARKCLKAYNMKFCYQNYKKNYSTEIMIGQFLRTNKKVG